MGKHIIVTEIELQIKHVDNNPTHDKYTSTIERLIMRKY